MRGRGHFLQHRPSTPRLGKPALCSDLGPILAGVVGGRVVGGNRKTEDGSATCLGLPWLACIVRRFVPDSWTGEHWELLLGQRKRKGKHKKTWIGSLVEFGSLEGIDISEERKLHIGFILIFSWFVMVVNPGSPLHRETNKAMKRDKVHWFDWFWFWFRI